MKINQVFFSIIVLILMACCSSEVTISKLNRPSRKIFKQEIKQIKTNNMQYIANDPKVLENLINEEKYYFDRMIKTRNRIIDSLDFLKKSKLLIIDSKAEPNGNRIEFSYFFYDNKIIYAGFNKKVDLLNGQLNIKYVPNIDEVSITEIKKYNYDIYNIYYNLIKTEDKNLSVLNWGSEGMTHFVTLINKKKVNYYSVSGVEKYKVVKLN